MKRIFDLIMVLTISLILLPLVIIITFLVWVKLGTPVLYIQARPGWKGGIFHIYKYRTMTFQRDDNGDLLPDKDRLTNFGKFLRSTSLDELPGFLNVLKGDMSLVGPRPLLIEYLPLYSKKHSRRHEVKPGITGWAQVNGRNAISWNDKFNLDVWYIDNQSFWLDIKILLLTIKKVITRDNISQNNHVTMEKYKG
jgi:lipopolysaccharide/colanic/teichoic acid biosynthesis glycosyltransferase